MKQSGGFTDKAKTALLLAEKTALRMKAGYVGTEHILVGLLKEKTGVAARVLTEDGAKEDKILEMIRELISPEANVVLKERRGIPPGPRRCLRKPTDRQTVFRRKRQGQSISCWLF